MDASWSGMAATTIGIAIAIRASANRSLGTARLMRGWRGTSSRSWLSCFEFDDKVLAMAKAGSNANV